MDSIKRRGRAVRSSRTRYETVLEIQIGDDVPEQGQDVYDAVELKRNLSPAVAAGEQR